jgi:hypothetical protein
MPSPTLSTRVDGQHGELCRGHSIEYRALLRQLSPDRQAGILIVVASCYYGNTGVELYFQDFCLMQIPPTGIVAQHDTFYAASATSPIEIANPPQSISVTDAFGTHAIAVERWEGNPETSHTVNDGGLSSRGTKAGARDTSDLPADFTALFQLAYGQSVKLATLDGLYVGDGITLGTSATSWILVTGSYGQLRGYWIFRWDVVCWQAVNSDGPLEFWNADSNASGDPQDWELFIFEPVDVPRNQVRIKNIYGKYVNRIGGILSCTSDQTGAAVFVITFVSNPPGWDPNNIP